MVSNQEEDRREVSGFAFSTLQLSQYVILLCVVH